MAGKPRKSIIKDAWGGARKGTGPKSPIARSETAINEMLAKAKKRAKVEKKDLDDILLDFCYGTQGEGWKMTIRDRLAAIDMWKKYTMTKTSEQNINITKTRGPAIGLPPMRDDPAKLIPIKGGKK